MRVLFLDVDGVIDDPKKRNHLSMHKLDHLINVCNATGCRVVVSSHWRLVQPLFSRFLAVIRYLGVEVIGATPVHIPSAPERPREILEWLRAYNDAASTLKRPPVTQFAVIDDRDLLNEVAGKLLAGRFVRTEPASGMTQEHADQIADIFEADQAGSLPFVPGLTSVVAAVVSTPFEVPHGQFCEVRLKKAPLSEVELQSGADSVTLVRYTCSLATKATWSGVLISVGNGHGKRPVPWIVTDTPGGSKRWLTRTRLSCPSVFVATGRIDRRDKLVIVPDAAGALSDRRSTGSEELREWLASTVIIGSQIGSGMFGTVYLGCLVGDFQSAVAVKRAPADADIRRESRLLSKLSHPHITQLVASFEDVGVSSIIYLVLELCEGPDLQTLLDARGALLEAEARRLFAQLLDALCYLRHHSVIHRDLKPANCMLKHFLTDLHTTPLTNSHLKLLDFGFAKCLDGVGESRHGSNAFRSNAWFGASPFPWRSNSRHGGSVYGGSNSPVRNSSRRRSPLTASSSHINTNNGRLYNAGSSSKGQGTAVATPSNVEGDGDAFRNDTPSPFPSRDVAPVAARRGSSCGVGGRPLCGGIDGGGCEDIGVTWDREDVVHSVQRDPSVHGISPKGTRLYSDQSLVQAACSKNANFKDGKLQMTREEALQLDAVSLGRMLRQMLTGAKPNQAITEAISEEQSASCVGCVLWPVRGSRPPRRIVEPSQLTKPLQDLLNIFAKNARDRFTVVEARAHEWLAEESVHAGHIAFNVNNAARDDSAY